MFSKINEAEIDALEKGFMILRVMYLWPKKGHNTTNITEIIGVLFALIFYPTVSILCASYLVFIFTSGSNYLFNDVLTSITAGISGTFIYLVIVSFLWSRKKIKQLLLRLTDFERFGKPPQFDRLNRKLNLLLIFAAIYGASGVFSFLILATISKNECIRDAQEYDLYMICGLILPVWLPFDVDNNLKFYLIHAIHYFSCTLLCMAGMLIMFFIFAAVELLILKITHFKILIDNSFRTANSEEKSRYFSQLVEYHVELIGISLEISDAFGEILLLIILCSALVIGILGFQCMLEFNIRNILHLMGWFVSFSCPCLAGQRLINATETIPFHVYSTTWYNEGIKMQKKILFSIMRSNYHLEIKAKNYGNLSMVTYGSVIQTAYSFLAMLAQTYDFDKQRIPLKKYETNATYIYSPQY